MEKNTIKFLPGEKWALVRGIRNSFGEKYAISNNGRLAKFSKEIKKGSLLKGGLQGGYPIWRFMNDGMHKHFLLHRLVAKYFLPAPARDTKILLHLNHIKTDNHYKNLSWATQKQATAHQLKDSVLIKAKALRLTEGIHRANAKLTEAKVRTIKKLLTEGKKLKEIAVKYKVSDMQIHRIKTGENWAHVK